MIAATLNSNVWVVALAGAISFGVPLTLAALGEILGERSGVLNLGVEGMMLIGAVCAFLAGDQFHNPWVALAAGILAGGALSLVHAVLSVTLRANQIVSGLALVIFGTGLAHIHRTVGRRQAARHASAADGDPRPLRHPDHRPRPFRARHPRLRDVRRDRRSSRSTCSRRARASHCGRSGNRRQLPMPPACR